MPLRSLLKFHRYAFAWENYLLLVRVIRAALEVRRALEKEDHTRPITPYLKAALPVIPQLRMASQPGWRISEPEKIALFASFIVTIPLRWGRCLQRSLILWRLLNGYGIPTRLCIGVNRNPPADGHVWVTRHSDEGRAFAEEFDPHERFLMIHTTDEKHRDA